ncbi:hypothetical protein [Acinetobacter pittii]|uniref:hypothetical protein n=1 Tax=Acinetobacter pittii TaxID=48296 RepID=UPI0023800C69|nr:hypothetical protein [Acinetobacter pittii]MDE4038791.1 hypothetical protein [Acinetobacter pittii]
MTDLNKEREAFLNTFQYYKGRRDIIFSHDHELFMTRSNSPSEVAQKEISNMNSRWDAWLKCAKNRDVEQEKAKAQAVPVWVSTEFMKPDEGDLVLFLDKNNIIHEGYLNTDYVDGPYGENGEDLGDDQTLWASNSNGEEFLLEEVKYWMHRPNGPSASESGAEG